jgi:hypothetical protein
VAGRAHFDRGAAVSGRTGAAAARTITRRVNVYTRYLANGAPGALAYRIAYLDPARIRQYAHIMPVSRYNDGFNDYLNAAAIRALLRGEAEVPR